ncbi:DUF2510 domain-containing protein [Kitasatospora cinereorecta]
MVPGRERARTERWWDGAAWTGHTRSPAVPRPMALRSSRAPGARTPDSRPGAPAPPGRSRRATRPSAHPRGHRLPAAGGVAAPGPARSRTRTRGRYDPRRGRSARSP